MNSPKIVTKKNRSIPKDEHKAAQEARAKIEAKKAEKEYIPPIPYDDWLRRVDEGDYYYALRILEKAGRKPESSQTPMMYIMLAKKVLWERGKEWR